ncbi:acetate uptake transporter [Picrophilus oshimae]|uniref:Transcriptional regulator n=1 Tax=Picrophilus torridus (strain ATCC 700027 / DSM 9790 / JCM 10055 / NBRC 100828 / KAW 2/3) TaxID=1122961 RepID=A0A8G2L821_PICTO|nr:GPR1/FUN34/YaaH family transporter [Picrophilus oshimae]SMD31630.1 transcriptional regulator [Picrophilus oshimae DSM 9789]
MDINNALKADPAPLGLAGFGLTTFLLSFVNAGILSGSAVNVVMPLAFAYGGFAQLLTGAFEMRRGNTFGFTAFTSYGSFWFFYAFLVIFNDLKIISIPGKALGIALILWGLFTLYMWSGTFRLNLALFLTFLFLWLAFIVLGFGSYYSIIELTRLGGIFGFLTAFFAVYTSFGIVNNSLKPGTIPLGPAILK